MFLLTALLFGTFLSVNAQIPKLAGKPTPADAPLADYFRNETAALSQQGGVADVKTLEEWTAKRPGYRRQLQEMLGYPHFFVWVILATIPSFIAALFIPLDAEFGKRNGK